MNKFPLIITLLLIFPSLSEAYLDPGAGSYILQMLIAGALGLIFTVKLYISKIKAFFSGLFGKESKNEDTEKE